MKTTKINVKVNLNPVKHHINRHYYEAQRLANDYHKGLITKAQAIIEFSEYLSECFGRPVRLPIKEYNFLKPRPIKPAKEPTTVIRYSKKGFEEAA